MFGGVQLKKVEKDEKKTDNVADKTKIMTSGTQIKKDEKESKKEEKKEDKKPNSIADRIKNISSGDQPKKEDKKQNSISDRIKNMNSVEIKKNEEPKKPNNILDKNKGLTSSETSKKEEKQKEPQKKLNNFEDKINFGGGKPNPSSTSNKFEPQRPALAKRGSAFEANIGKFGGGKKNETSSSSKPQPVNSFNSKLSQINEMFKKQGFGQKTAGGHRPSMMIGMPQNFRFGKGMQMSGSSGGSKASEIIREEPDKMKAGYDPAASLQKTLDSVVVVQKKKKKKKKPVAFKG